MTPFWRHPPRWPAAAAVWRGFVTRIRQKEAVVSVKRCGTRLYARCSRNGARRWCQKEAVASVKRCGSRPYARCSRNGARLSKEQRLLSHAPRICWESSSKQSQWSDDFPSSSKFLKTWENLYDNSLCQVTRISHKSAHQRHHKNFDTTGFKVEFWELFPDYILGGGASVPGSAFLPKVCPKVRTFFPKSAL